MSRFCEFRTKGIQFAKDANNLYQRCAFQQAAELYEKAAQHLQVASKYERDAKQQNALIAGAQQYNDKAREIYTYLNSVRRQPPTPQQQAASSSTSSSPHRNSERAETDDNAKLKKALSSAIITEKPKVTWNDVAGLEEAKRTLREAVILPIRLPHIFNGKRQPWRGVLLYGPPGTGKSYLAKALANEAEATFFSVSSSDLVSKWVGESERLVRSLFEMARENKPAIIFIDEVDALCSSRSDSSSDSSRRIMNEFLVQMNGVREESEDAGVVVLGATNTPWSLDSAIRRRFERRVHIGLPCVEARTRMIVLHAGNTPCTVTRENIEEFAQKTEGMSGSDIEIFVRDAIMAPVRRLEGATHFRRVITADGKKGIMACSPGDEGAQEVSLTDIPSEKIIVPPVTYNDFAKALSKCKSSVSVEDIKRYEQFTQEFGQEGN